MENVRLVANGTLVGSIQYVTWETLMEKSAVANTAADSLKEGMLCSVDELSR